MSTGTAVIIPCKNEAHRLPRQLQALNLQTDLDFEVIVSDNGSTDATVLVAEGWEGPFTGGIKVADSSDRPGVAHARNVAVGYSGAALILICDGDDVVHPSWVAAMREALAEHDLATGPLHLKFPRGQRRNTVWNATEVPTSMGYRAYAPGGNIGMHRHVFDALGGFDENLSMGQEDVDFGWRAVGRGFKIGHAAGAALDYYQRGDLRASIRQQWRYGRAHVMLYNKHRHAAGIPSPASNKASLRWFWEWAKQLPRNLSSGRGREAVSSMVFQGSRFYHSLRMGRSPL